MVISDLANFARASTACLGPARWHLYKSVVLRNDSPWLSEVCSLLEGAPGLKMRVTSILVITVEYWAESNGRISRSSSVQVTRKLAKDDIWHILGV